MTRDDIDLVARTVTVRRQYVELTGQMTQRPRRGSVRMVFCLVELRGLEPLTPCLQSRCSSS